MCCYLVIPSSDLAWSRDRILTVFLFRYRQAWCAWSASSCCSLVLHPILSGRSTDQPAVPASDLGASVLESVHGNPLPKSRIGVSYSWHGANHPSRIPSEAVGSIAEASWRRPSVIDDFGS